jgi:hypothetical protein
VTLEVAADYLGISYRNMRGLLSAWGISLKTTPLDQIRVRYIRELRHAAGEDDPSNPEKLIAERMATAREQGEL